MYLLISSKINGIKVMIIRSWKVLEIQIYTTLNINNALAPVLLLGVYILTWNLKYQLPTYHTHDFYLIINFILNKNHHVYFIHF